MMIFLQNLLDLSLEAAPWLVMGFVLGGLMKALIPTAFLQKHLSGHGFGSISKAAVLGAPLPLCSCGVIPAALGLRKAGASKPATASFLVSTPETGVDSVSITYALMGPLMAVVRPVAALVSALTAGSLVALFDRHEHQQQGKGEASATAGCCGSDASKTAEATEKTATTSCCSSEQQAAVATSCCSSEKPETVTTSCCSSEQQAEPVSSSSCCASETAQAAEVSACCDNESVATEVMASSEASGCCGSEVKAVKEPVAEGSCCSSAGANQQQESWAEKAWGGVHYAFTRLLDDIAFWLVIGMLFAAATKTFLPADFLSQWGQGIGAMLVMMLVGIPMYICATASTPMAAGLMMAGMSPGVALVFLLTGPATNVSTLGVIGRELGQRSMWLYLGAVGVTAIVSGLLLDAAVNAWNIDIATHLHAGHESFPVWVQWAALILLLGMGLRKLPLQLGGKLNPA